MWPTPIVLQDLDCGSCWMGYNRINVGRLCLIYGVNNETLTMGRPNPVTEEARYATRHAVPGGGFVLTSGNTLQLCTRWKDDAAMRAAAREYRIYPIRVS
jgi:hypothetical protein